MTLEINTIIKSDMSTTKMPNSRRQALYELARMYSSKLEELKVREPVVWKYAGMESFGELRDRATEGISILSKKLHNAPPDKKKDISDQLAILERIQYQSSQVVGMFKLLKEKSKFFCWDEIPGNHNARIINFLIENLSIDWIKTATIEKIDNKTIRLYTEENQLFLRLNNDKTKASIKTDDGRSYSLTVKKENGKLNIYNGKKIDEFIVMPENDNLTIHDTELWNNDIDRQRMNEIEDLDITPDHVIMIRKAWDIGTEKIVMQTFIQLDGDVTTRISDRLFENPYRENIFKIHNDSIQMSTKFWSNLVGALTTIAGDVSKILVGKK